MASLSTIASWVGCHPGDEPCGSICCAMDQYCAFDGQCSASSVQTSSTDPTGLAGLSPLTTTPASGSNGETSPSPTEASATPTVAFSTSTSEITTSMINSTLTGAKTSARTSVTVPPAVGTHSASFTTSSVSTRPSSQDSSSDRAGPVPPSPGQIAGIVLGGLLLIILLGLLWTVLRYSIGPGIKSPVSILRAALALPPRLEDGPSNGDYGEEMKVTTRHAYQGQKRSRHWYGTPKRRHSLSNEDISPEHFSSGSNSSMSWTSRGPTQKARLYDLLIDILLGESSRRRGQSDHGEGSEVSATEICRDWARRTVESVSPVRRTTRPFRRAISPTSRDSPNLGLKTLSLPSEASRPDVDIVFVHGLTGNSHSTWFHEKRQIHWPTALLGRSLGDEGVNARIFAFGYDANVVNLMGPASRNRIGNHAINLLGALARRRETSTSVSVTDPVVFIISMLVGSMIILSASSNSYLSRIALNILHLAYSLPNVVLENALTIWQLLQGLLTELHLSIGTSTIPLIDS